MRRKEGRNVPQIHQTCYEHRKISCQQLMHETEKEVAQHNLAPFVILADNPALCNVGRRIRYGARKSCDFETTLTLHTSKS